MIAVALKGLLGRKTRAILTALAIVLGTGMVSATFIFTDTLNKAFNGVFSSSYKQTSVVVSGKQIVTGAATAPTVPASLARTDQGRSRRRSRLRRLPLRNGQARRRQRQDDRRQRRTAVRLRHRRKRQALQPARPDCRQLAQRP